MAAVWTTVQRFVFGADAEESVEVLSPSEDDTVAMVERVELFECPEVVLVLVHWECAF